VNEFINHFFSFVGGHVEVEDKLSFWLSEYKICFLCKNETRFIVNGSTTVHDTTTPKPIGISEIAFVQKKQFITQLSKALKNLNEDLTLSYFKAKDCYMTWQVNCFSNLNKF